MHASNKVYLVFTSNNKMYPYFPSSSLALAAALRSGDTGRSSSTPTGKGV